MPNDSNPQTPPNVISFPSVDHLTEARKRFNIRTPAELAKRVTELKATESIIDGLIPQRSISLVVGDSGLGKSPFLYQAAICVASGLPFLGMATKQGRVLWMDCENTLDPVLRVVRSIGGYLNLKEPPEDLYLWNINDAEGFGTPGHNFEDIVREFKPLWVIVDPLRAIFTGIDEKNGQSIEDYSFMRGLMSETGTTITGVHHVRKPSADASKLPPALDKYDSPHEWFLRAIGARSMITGCDMRIGVDKPTLSSADLVVRGYERLRGEVPAMLLTREADASTGDAIGYRRMAGIDLMTNQDYRAAYLNLPSEFRFKDARAALGRGDSSTVRFLGKCEGAGILQKGKDGLYVKLTPTDEATMPRAA